jgi:hypothetical protein
MEDERGCWGNHGENALYTVDELDTVVELKEVPQSDVGAPLPVVISDEHTLVLGYISSKPDPEWDGSYTTILSPASKDVPIAIIRFRFPYAHMFGPPNDEAFCGHPLAGRGLHPYGAFRVLRSSWIRRLERMNLVHPFHDPEWFEELNHYVFAFHDSTFECVAREFSVTMQMGSLQNAMSDVRKLLAW